MKSFSFPLIHYSDHIRSENNSYHKSKQLRSSHFIAQISATLATTKDIGMQTCRKGSLNIYNNSPKFIDHDAIFKKPTTISVQWNQARTFTNISHIYQRYCHSWLLNLCKYSSTFQLQVKPKTSNYTSPIKYIINKRLCNCHRILLLYS